MIIRIFILFFVLFQNSLQASIYEVSLSDFDQAHLSGFITKLPHDLIDSYTENIEGPLEGKKVISVFRTIEFGLGVNCWEIYYNDSAWPSFTGCKLTINTDNQNVNIKNDQAKIEIMDNYLASSFYNAIPFGRHNKHFFSFNKNIGTNFQGEEIVNIFDFFFNCSEQNCELLFYYKEK